mgnify:CR=1 FL=1
MLKINVPLGLSHCLMSGSSWAKPVTMRGESRVPVALQDLQQRLLDETIQHSRYAELSHSVAIRLGDAYSLYRLRSVGSVQQFLTEGRPIIPQEAWQFIDGHPVDSRTPSVCLNSFQRFLQICSLADLLHQLRARGGAFVDISRCKRFSPQYTATMGFTRFAMRKGQQKLNFLLHVVCKINETINPSIPFGPSSHRFRSCEPGLFLPSRASVPLKRTDCMGLLCPLLTSADRSNRLTTASVRKFPRCGSAYLLSPPYGFGVPH